MLNNKKIDIITLHRVGNYGSVLQAYALQEVFEKKGNKVEIIDYYPRRLTILGMLKGLKNKNKKLKESLIWRTICRILILPSYILRKYTFRKFLKKYLKLTPKTYKVEDELYRNVPEADLYCTGSDQVWNVEWNEKIERPFFLDFVPEKKVRFAYAASFGRKELEDWEKEETTNMLKKYRDISMREISGVNILRELGLDGINVLDPTLLLNKEEWMKIASKKYKNKNYILMYNLNRNKKIDYYVQKLAKEKNLDIYYITYSLHEIYKKGKMKCNVRVEDFLALIANAKYVVTDSFHATAFSINFNTQFMIVFPEKFSTRVESILKTTGLKSRIVNNYKDVSLADKIIDFSESNKRLEEQRKIANEYIDKAIR